MADDRIAPPDAGEPTEPEAEPTSSAPAEAEVLRVEAEARAREAAQAQDRYLRTLADFDNFRKRVERERAEWRDRAQAELVRDILPVLDNFERALAVGSGPGSDSGFRAGVELIHRDFLTALERLGVRPFRVIGEPFDPARHEAVGRVEREDVADQTVVEEVLRGYLFRERVLRPAQVVVAVEPAPPSPGEAAS